MFQSLIMQNVFVLASQMIKIWFILLCGLSASLVVCEEEPLKGGAQQQPGKKHYYISQLVRAVWLVNLPGRILLYGPLILKVCFPVRPINQRYDKYLTNLVFLGPYCKLRILVYGPRASRLGHKRTRKNSVRNLQYGSPTRLVRRIKRLI